MAYWIALMIKKLIFLIKSIKNIAFEGNFGMFPRLSAVLLFLSVIFAVVQGCYNLKVQCQGVQSSIQFNGSSSKFNVTSSKFNSKFNVMVVPKSSKFNSKFKVCRVGAGPPPNGWVCSPGGVSSRVRTAPRGRDCIVRQKISGLVRWSPQKKRHQVRKDAEKEAQPARKKNW